MGFNYAREKKKFEEEWKKKAEWYRSECMDEDAIQAMYEFDLAEFNSSRKFYRYTDDIDAEQRAATSEDTLDKALSNDWIELIDSPELVRKIRKLPGDYIKIIDILYRENVTQEEIAARLSCSQQNIAKKIEKIKKLLK